MLYFCVIGSHLYKDRERYSHVTGKVWQRKHISQFYRISQFTILILLLLLLMKNKSIGTLGRGISEFSCHRKSMEISKIFLD